jgi:hypothetical protein
MRSSVFLLGGLLLCGPANAACNETLITFVSWTLTPLNAHDNEMVTVFKSNAAKAIKEIDALAGFKELSGEEIGRFALYPYLQFEAGGETTDTSTWGPHTFESLLTRKPEDLTTFACVKSVVYDDGSKEIFEPQP